MVHAICTIVRELSRASSLIDVAVWLFMPTVPLGIWRVLRGASDGRQEVQRQR